MHSKLVKVILVIIIALCCFIQCRDKSISSAFEVLEHETTNLTFRNDLKSYNDFNMFKYMYFFNGAGVGTGDLNNDGLVDVFFAANQGQNELYLNRGEFKFENVTAKAQIPRDSSWSTGVSICDVNGDGFLDIYVSRVGNFGRLQSKNQLLICKGLVNGIPVYDDMAKEYGVDFSAFSTQAAFFDYDLDGDLDLYLLNHSLRYNGTFFEKSVYTNNYDTLASDRLLKLENDTFIEVTKNAGISGNIISYGLGICISDVNLDGYPDIYVGNDFHENDYMYINNGDGTFTDKASVYFDCTSQFTMGVDIADLNNDAFPEIVTMDMLPSDPLLLKKSLGEDSYDLFQTKLKYGYQHQYTRNTLQLNLEGKSFAEIGRFAGIFATDWSWSVLLTDLNNDGWKDIFVSNGIPKRMNDIDFIKFISNESFQKQVKDDNYKREDLDLIGQFPEVKIENRFFKNNRNNSFLPIDHTILNNKKSFSNGAAYADFDNDGDIDIIVNNINDYPFIYKNNLDMTTDSNLWFDIHLTMDGLNTNALGSKVIVFIDSERRLYENITTRGFMSSMSNNFHIGIGPAEPDSIYVVWPNNTYQRIKKIQYSKVTKLKYENNLPKFDYTILRRSPKVSILDITKEYCDGCRHNENPFIEFDREPLMPFMVSRAGPALCVADINKDGLEDFYIGGAKGYSGELYLQQTSGKFLGSKLKIFQDHSKYEDVSAQFVDLNNDNNLDLVVASGGNEYSLKSEYYKPRLYLNNGFGDFRYLEKGISDSLLINASCIVPFNYNNDEYIDLFIGGRSVPYNYGKSPNSYILINNCEGKFIIDKRASSEISKAGFVTDAKTIDFDKNRDLFLCSEWSSIFKFSLIDNVPKLEKIIEKNGWWNTIELVDADNDNDYDILAGNLGLNTKLRVSEKQPLILLYGDIDGNGESEQFITNYYFNSKIMFHNYEELTKQIPPLKKKYLKASDFAKSKPSDIILTEMKSKFNRLEFNFGSNCILINQGNRFEMRPLPLEAQYSNITSICQMDYNDDKIPDFLCGGNFFHNNIHSGNNDASPCLILEGLGDCNYKVSNLKAQISGEIRKVKPISIKGKKSYILAKNNEYLQLVTLSQVN